MIVITFFLEVTILLKSFMKGFRWKRKITDTPEGTTGGVLGSLVLTCRSCRPGRTPSNDLGRSRSAPFILPRWPGSNRDACVHTLQCVSGITCVLIGAQLSLFLLAFSRTVRLQSLSPLNWSPPLAAFCLQPSDMASVSASSQGAPASTGPLQRGIVKMVSTPACERVSSLRDCSHTAN